MKKQRIKQTIYRILMSEVLPYELPLFVSNNRYYIIADMLRLCFHGDRVISRGKSLKGKNNDWANAFITLLNGNGEKKKSFNYFINKKDGKKARELVMVHPYMQLKLMEFYKSCDSLILNFCQKSHFSLRYPLKRATFVRPKSNMPKAAAEYLDYKANETPKHYFHYEKYQNINAFYAGREFQRLENHFKFLYKADIHHCFDVIPIDELSQLLYQTTEKINDSCTFAGRFTRLMSEMNEGRSHQDPTQGRIGVKKDKTNSVLIGPEFSRLFAEMFLQQIDVAMEKRMSYGPELYSLHRDYECFRYVDDIFFFYNDPKVYSKFYGVLIEELHKHGGIRLNIEKNHIYETPFVNKLTIARRALGLVVEKMLEDRLHTTQGMKLREEQNFYDFPLKMKAQYAIIDVKTILKQNDVQFNEVSAGMLAHLHRKLSKALDEIDTLMDEYRSGGTIGLLDRKGMSIWLGYEKQMVYYFREMIKFLFYLFNSDMRMNTSIRVLSLLNMIVSYFQGRLFNETSASSKALSDDAKNKIYKTIIDELTFILKHNHLNMLNGLEISNLMMILNCIPENYEIDIRIWNSFIGDAFDHYEDEKANILMALTLMMVFGRNNVNRSSRNTICRWLIEDVRMHNWSVDDTESFLIMINMMTSPFIEHAYKDEILSHVEERFRRPLEIISKQRSPFMQWSEFKLAKACQAKYAADVY